MAVAVDQHHELKPFIRPPCPRCRLQSYSQIDYMAASSFKRTFQFIQRSFSTPCLSLDPGSDCEDANPRIEIILGHGMPCVRALVVEVAIALTSGVITEPIMSGLGGAYFFRARNCEIIAVAKPIDEEPLAFNNPKGFSGRMFGQPGLKRSIRVGETGIREVAAYLLDHAGFAGVPPTALVKISHVKFHTNDSESKLAPDYRVASLQRFVDHVSDAGDLGSSGFSVASIHQIGILDVRLLNLDRHAGNMLVKHGKENCSDGAAELVPIDHGFCLPESLDDPYFEWLHWPQASIPFSESETEYILNLDPIRDAERLRSELPSVRESSIRVLVVCTIFLKQATAAGLCLADIGEMMTREFCRDEEFCWSILETLCINAKASIVKFLTSDDHMCYSMSEDQDEQEMDIFQLDLYDDNLDVDFPKLPQRALLKAKSLDIPRISPTNSMSILRNPPLAFLQEDDYDQNGEDLDLDSIVDSNDNGSSAHKEDCDSLKVGGGFMKSMSFSALKCNNDGGCISFDEMDQVEWDMFLEIFQRLLPEAFARRKNMGLSKQRLGTSCEF